MKSLQIQRIMAISTSCTPCSSGSFMLSLSSPSQCLPSILFFKPWKTSMANSQNSRLKFVVNSASSDVGSSSSSDFTSLRYCFSQFLSIVVVLALVAVGI